jgi:hypothetical protein
VFPGDAADAAVGQAEQPLPAGVGRIKHRHPLADGQVLGGGLPGGVEVTPFLDQVAEPAVGPSQVLLRTRVAGIGLRQLL